MNAVVYVCLPYNLILFSALLLFEIRKGPSCLILTAFILFSAQPSLPSNGFNAGINNNIYHLTAKFSYYESLPTIPPELRTGSNS